MKIKEIIEALEIAIKFITDIQDGKEQLTEDIRGKLLKIYSYAFNERMKYYDYYYPLIRSKSPEREKEELAIIEQTLGGDFGSIEDITNSFTREIEKYKEVVDALKQNDIDPKYADNQPGIRELGDDWTLPEEFTDPLRAARELKEQREQRKKEALKRQVRDLINAINRQTGETIEDWELPDDIANYVPQIEEKPKQQIEQKPKTGIFKRIFTAIKTTVKTGATKIKNLFKKRK